MVNVVMRLVVVMLALLFMANSAVASVMPLVVTPSSTAADNPAGLTIQTEAGAAGEPVFIEFYHELGTPNGAVDPGEWAKIRAVVHDNGASSDFMMLLSGDTDPSSPGITSLFQMPGGILPVGSFVCRATNLNGDYSEFGVTITAPTQTPGQLITGTVTVDGGAALEDALIYLASGGADGPEALLNFTYTDATGAFTCQVPEGVADTAGMVGAVMEGFLENPGSESELTIDYASANIGPVSLDLLSSDALIDGTVTDADTAGPLVGVVLWAGTMDGKQSDGLSDPAGFFEIPALSGQNWWVEGEPPAGYIGLVDANDLSQDWVQVNVTESGPNTADMLAFPENAWLDATVLDETGTLPVENALVFATRTFPTPPYLESAGYNDETGFIHLGVREGNWEVGVCVNCHLDPAMIEGSPVELVPPPVLEVFSILPAQSVPVYINTFYADGAIEGDVSYDCCGADPVGPAVRIDARTDGSTGVALNGLSQDPVSGHIMTSAETDDAGHFRLPVLSGTWWLRADSEDECLSSAWTQVDVDTDGDEVIESPDNGSGVDEVVGPIQLELNIPCNHCWDGQQNYGEEGVDCGGFDCGPCSSCEPDQEPNDDSLNAIQIFSPYFGNGTMDGFTGDYYDWYTFDANTDEQISIMVSWDSNPENYMDVWLFDDQESELSMAPGTESPKYISYTAPYTGTYYIQVSSGSSSTCYSLSLSTGGGAHCFNQVQDYDEEGVDCGGSDCAPCPDGGISGAVIYGGGATGIIGIGVFTDPSFSGDTVGDALLFDPGPFDIPNLPDGTYYLASTMQSGPVVDVYDPSGYYGLPGPPAPVVVSGSVVTGVDIAIYDGTDNDPNPFAGEDVLGFHCFNGVQDADEEGIDCGGYDCDPCDHCTNGIQDLDEEGVDCGGNDCQPCETCFDGIQNQDEEGVDCGGTQCDPCIPTGLSEDFETASAGLWTYDGLWHLVDDSVPGPQPDAFSPTNAMWYGQDGTGNYDTPPDANSGTLDSFPFTVPADAALSFWSWEQTENDAYGDYDTKKVYITTDGGANWDLLYQSFEDNNAWSLVMLDLAPYAGMDAVVRFEFATGDNFNNEYLGWLVDDVIVDTTHCFNGVQDSDETDVDCGGADCMPCDHCANGVQDADETGIDCGGADCPVCPDTTPPVSEITDPTDGDALATGLEFYFIYGTASDDSSGVTLVEVSTDGGATWNPASDNSAPNGPRERGAPQMAEPPAAWSTWEYRWETPADGCWNLLTRATDGATNVETPGPGVTVGVGNAHMDSLTPVVNEGGPAQIGKTIIWQAAASGACDKEYRYQLLPEGGSWSIARGWSSDPDWAWSPSTAGNYQVVGQVRKAGGTTPESAVNSGWYEVYDPEAPAGLSNLKPDPVTPQEVNTTITWSGTPTGGSGSYQLRFWVWDGTWGVAQNWSSATTFAWTPTHMGKYQIKCDVRNAGATGVQASLAYPWMYVITDPAVSPCSLDSLVPTPGSPVNVNDLVQWEAFVASGSGTYEFRFWVHNGSSWSVGQPWSGSATFEWTPTVAGTYKIVVQARNEGASLNVEDAINSGAFIVNVP